MSTEDTNTPQSGDDTTTVLSSGRPVQVKLPRGNYKLRIKEEPEFKIVQRSGNEMLLFLFEIIDPEVKLVRDAKGQVHELKTSGLELRLPATFFRDRNGNIQNIALSQIHQNVGYPLTFQRDPDSRLPVDESGNPFIYSGIEVMADCGGSEQTVKDDDGKPLVNPLTGKEKKMFSRSIFEIYVPEGETAVE